MKNQVAISLSEIASQAKNYQLSESMGLVSWLPGKLPLGRSVVALDSGVVMEVEFLPAGDKRLIQWVKERELSLTAGKR